MQHRLAELTELVEKSRPERSNVRDLVRQGRWLEAEPEQERLARYVSRHLDAAPAGAEAIQGATNDLQPVRFLSLGADARRAVGYVEATTATSSTTGSGFLVSPRAFLTNAHVIPDLAAATGAVVTFDREQGTAGRPRSISTYLLDPDGLALFSDEDHLDYALLAVGARSAGEVPLSDLGFCPLTDWDDKHVIGMPVNIVQHPRGWPKMVAIRNNFLAYRTPTTLLYETDTDEGSSGSPVFNDDWEVVALHHWGEPHLEEQDGEGRPYPTAVNEGVRISAIYGDLQHQLDSRVLSAAQQELLTEVLSYSRHPTLNGRGAGGSSARRAPVGPKRGHQPRRSRHRRPRRRT